MNPWVAYVLGCFAGGWSLDFLRWLYRQREEREAPLFVTWQDALTWAYEHPGRLAKSSDGATVRAGGPR